MSSTADVRAELARAQAAAAKHPTPVRQSPDPAPGLAAFVVGTAIVLMPALDTAAPPRVVAAYTDRIVANATGRCPRCDAVVAVASTTTAQVEHERTCALARKWTDRDRAYLHPAGVQALVMMAAKSATDDPHRLH